MSISGFALELDFVLLLPFGDTMLHLNCADHWAT